MYVCMCVMHVFIYVRTAVYVCLICFLPLQRLLLTAHVAILADVVVEVAAAPHALLSFRFFIVLEIRTLNYNLREYELSGVSNLQNARAQHRPGPGIGLHRRVTT